MMQLLQIAFAAALLPLACAIRFSKPERGWCATSPSDSAINSLEDLQVAEEAAKGNRALPPRQSLVVPTYFHAVVNSSVGPSVLGEAALQGQLDVMNEKYRIHGISFELLNSTRRVDNNLARGPIGDVPDVEAFYAYLQESRVGGYDTVNIYFYSDFDPDTFGACSLPDSNLPKSLWWEDGCHIASGTIPGGEIEEYNLGLTAVHEIGHWLGLLHTFETQLCSGSGDMIDDTPQEAAPTFGCPTSKDSCPGIAGADPIHNYMDYSTDPCYSEFTPGQQARMLNSYATIREGKTA